MPHFHVTVHGDGRTAMVDLVRTHEVTVLRQTLAERNGGYTVSAIADQATIFPVKCVGIGNTAGSR